jgi:3-methyladenine DNA glycosylase AlkD
MGLDRGSMVIFQVMGKIMSSPLEREFDYFLANQEELVRKYQGKFVVIKDQQVIGTYNSELEALKETTKTHELGTFLVQRAEPGSESYTQVYHSRVAFC